MSRAKTLHDILTTPEARERNKHLLAGENHLPVPVQPRQTAQEGLGQNAKGKDKRKSLKTPLKPPKFQGVTYDLATGRVKAIRFQYDLKGLNHFKNYWQRQKEIEMFDIFLWENCLRYPTVPTKQKQRVTVTRILGPRQRVFDDGSILAGSAKQLIDRMTHANFWIDDKPKYLQQIPKQADNQRHLGPAVLVEIEVV